MFSTVARHHTARFWFRLLSAGVSVIIVGGLLAATSSRDAMANGSCPLSGGGTVADPYQVSEPAHLGSITACGVGNHYRQTENLTLSGNHTPIGTFASPFSGSFDGGGKTIGNLVVNVTDQDGGLFGVVAAGGTITNVTITSGSVTVTGIAGTDAPGAGGLVGSSHGTITNSSAHVDVTGSCQVGGFVGRNTGSISGSSASGSVIFVDAGCSGEAGGFVGYNDGTGSVISGSSASGSVTGDDEIGGFVGENEGTIQDSSSTGAVTGSGTEVGGFVGYNDRGTIQTSTAAGNATGDTKVGGFAGENRRGTIENCDASGSAQAAIEVAGGFVGNNLGGSVSGSTAGGTVTAGGFGGGFVGQNRHAFVDGDPELGILREGRIHRSKATGNVNITTANAAPGSRGGGFVGENSAVIESSFASGNTTVANDRSGGFAGVNTASGEISDSYAFGNASSTGEEAGGFVGSSAGTISRSYSTGEASGSAKVGGFSGVETGTTTLSFWNVTTSGQNASASGTSKTTAQMRSFTTFADATWDIADGWVPFAPTATPARVWGICSPGSSSPDVNGGYPFLLWQFDSEPCSAGTPEASTGGATPGGVAEKRSGDAGIHLDFRVSVGDVASGSTVAIGGQGLFGGSEYSLVVRSSPQTLHAGTVSSLGNFGKRVTMPALPAGSHTLTLSAVAADGSILTLVQSFSVGPDGTITALGVPAGSQATGLAATGPSGLRGGIGFAGLVVILGIALVMATRRYQVLS